MSHHSYNSLQVCRTKSLNQNPNYVINIIASVLYSMSHVKEHQNSPIKIFFFFKWLERTVILVNKNLLN